jgi:heat-inducible transcriptional repressor
MAERISTPLTADANIGYRARKILHAVVSEYLSSGEAVGSRTVTRRHGIDLSAATVRNVMSDLEELGLLRQPHQSAGRVPTDQGLRMFVDSLLKVRGLSPQDKDEIRGRFGLPEDFEAAMQSTSRVLSDLSRQAAVVVLPTPERSVCDHLEFLKLREGELLAVLVTREGRVENKLVSIDFAITASDLERMHNYIDGLVSGRTLDEARARLVDELSSDEAQMDALLAKALTVAAQAIPAGAVDGAAALTHVLVDGQANLLDQLGPEDMFRAKALFRALEEKKLMAKLLERTLAASGIQVFIGAETAAAELTDCSVIATTYGDAESGRPLGALAVVGPTRMNYSRIIPIVDFTARLVTDLILRL